MPPRNAPSRGAFRGARGGRTPLALGNRGGGAGRGSQPGRTPSTAASHITTIGVRRPNFGTAGRPLLVAVNSFALTTSEHDISHYDDIHPDANMSYKTKFKLFHRLQDENPNIFTPKLVYDGQKMAYSTQSLDLGPENARKFAVSFEQSAIGTAARSHREPKVYNITLTKVATIGTEIIRRYINGQQSWDDKVSNALMAYNIAIRTEPNRSSPYRGRSFYIDSDRLSIGGGFEVWRGIFQSVRPAIGRLIINIDLTATIMYREGPLIHLVNEFLGKPTTTSPVYLNPRHQNFPSRGALSHLRAFMTGLRIIARSTGPSKPRTINGLTNETAMTSQFPTREGATMTVSQYFNQSLNMPLQFPNIICVKTGNGAVLPLEVCTVLRGQFYNRALDVPEAQIAQVLNFATKKPIERLESIKKGIEKLQFNQSNYIAQFGLSIDSQPIQVQARIIDAPTLKYSGQGRQAVQTPRNGAWNMLDKKFINPSKIRGVWAIAVFEDARRFNNHTLQELVKSFKDACSGIGIELGNPDPFVKYIANPQGSVEKQLRALGQECIKAHKVPPTLLLAILPDGAGDIYRDVKHFGDILVGIPTQCLRANKCMRAKSQYWNNVMLKVNVKLGGINTVPQSSAMEYITDPQNPTVVLGADVMHPGREDKPSITAVSGSVDSNASKYVAMSCVQKGRQEMISDMKEMCKFVLQSYKNYHEQVEKKSVANSSPKRLIFYRDGVSEPQFAHVLRDELPSIREACEELGMKPKITLIVVGKRHHNQIFPLNNKDNTNAPAGTIIDSNIMHPTDFDFLLQSHAGILGTSRPAHYSVLLDETGFNADSIQSLSYALCHAYARSTRAVSIPAPVYYADRVCNRSKIQFSRDGGPGVSDTSTQASGQAEQDLEAFKQAYKPIHQNQRKLMYFMACGFIF